MQQMVRSERIDGTKVLELRLKRHMAQRELALKAEITPETLNRIERATEARGEYRKVAALTARKLADALGVALEDITA